MTTPIKKSWTAEDDKELLFLGCHVGGLKADLILAAYKTLDKDPEAVRTDRAVKDRVAKLKKDMEKVIKE